MNKETYKQACDLVNTLNFAEADLGRIREALRLYQTPRDEDNPKSLPLVTILRAELVVHERWNYEHGATGDEEVFDIDAHTLVEVLQREAYKLELTIEKAQEQFDNL